MKGDDTDHLNANAAVVTAYARAWQDGDAATLVGLYHDEFTLRQRAADEFWRA